MTEPPSPLRMLLSRHTKRREFITFVAGVAVAMPRAARTQQSGERRHVGVMTGLPEDDSENQARLAGFRHGLEKRGWLEGRNLRIDYRFAPAASPDQVQLSAKELVALRPDVIFANATPIVAALQRETRAIPIVFAAVADPMGSGFIASLPQPGGNITGVMLYEPSVTGKWLSMLKEIAPQLVRAAFLVNPRSASFYNYYLRTAEPLSSLTRDRPRTHPGCEYRRDRARHRGLCERTERRLGGAAGRHERHPS